MSADKFPGIQIASAAPRLAQQRVSRRSFNRAALASLGSLALGGVPLQGMAARPGSGAVTRNPLRVPPTISPVSYPLAAAPASVELGGGKSSVLAYNGLMPGPTFRASRGGSTTIAFTNGLAEETTVHWHGMVVRTEADGHPQNAVPPGGTYDYTFPIVQRAALNWYHPHPHMLTGKQVCLGLAGAFIINDAEEAALNLPAGEYEIPLIVRDANFDKTGKMIYNPRTTGFDGKTPLVNGTLNPYLDVKPAVYRLRVLNGANARLFRLALSNGVPFTIIGNDGGLLEFPANASDIEFGPGERLDLIVDFRDRQNAKVMLRDVNAGWDLLEFRVTNVSTIPGTIPTTVRLSTIESLKDPVATRYFSFDGMSKINGLEYDLNRIDFQVPLGQTERWVFTTNGNAPHPVHVHGASFQVKKRTGGRGQLFPWEGGWKDTVLLLDQETVEVLIRFDQYAGLYLLHCHKLEHEDMGMMANFEVVSALARSPFGKI